MINIKMESDLVACLENQCLCRLCRLLNNVINSQKGMSVDEEFQWNGLIFHNEMKNVH